MRKSARVLKIRALRHFYGQHRSCLRPDRRSGVWECLTARLVRASAASAKMAAMAENRPAENEMEYTDSMRGMTKTLRHLIENGSAPQFFKHIAGKTFGCGAGRNIAQHA